MPGMTPGPGGFRVILALPVCDRTVPSVLSACDRTLQMLVVAPPTCSPTRKDRGCRSSLEHRRFDTWKGSCIQPPEIVD